MPLTQGVATEEAAKRYRDIACSGKGLVTADNEAALVLRLMQSLSSEEQLVLMSWLMKSPTERQQATASMPGQPDATPAEHWLSEQSEQWLFEHRLSKRWATAPRGSAPPLTDREAQVLRRVSEGADTATIGAEMSVSEAAVRAHLDSAAEKLRLQVRAANAPRTETRMTMLPVRLPRPTYDDLKRWASEHEFPMAVVVRGLVERFLTQQQSVPEG
jgi:DNA-binding CsgD family transcriptional regulator